MGMEHDHHLVTLRSNNSARAAYRTKCRQMLSDHIRIKLGIFVEPADIRLITSADDKYAWHVLPEKRHLFRKQLSKHSIGAYREICRGLGVSFEAVRVLESRTAMESESLEEAGCASRPEISFTTIIDQLKSDKLTLMAELEESNRQATETKELKELAEKKAADSQSIAQRVEIDNQRLQGEVQTLVGLVEHFRSVTLKSLDEFASKLKLDLSLFGS